METKASGYKSKKYDFPTKRYCQTLDLKNDPQLINEYVKRHSAEEHWPIVRDGIREVGILEMEIYLFGNRLFMIVETPLDFDWDKAFSILATLPRQAEWEEYMSVFQVADPNAASNEKWQLMDRIFNLYE
ncbi:L-rhamnose mutarotase [Dysgonomonas sp. 521]|uniref:L-rhamnose mutarotase n=1 Tax=Dysgonomonas sp. 521 TaxID=2302932 RepID=UPI0013CF540E|nr:L-rhamnose mutarotase [Dysgonomonas sp. 521]NDV95115.1 L-rhamnose mutarotase [Dysgonomonas sp. 521]